MYVFFALSVHDGSDEVFVVDVALAVLVAHQQLLGLLVAELLPERGEQVPQLRRGDEPVTVLVKVTETLDEVIAGVSRSARADGLNKLDSVIRKPMSILSMYVICRLRYKPA